MPLTTRAEIEAEVVAYLAGRAAEIVLLGEAGAGGGGGPDSDLARATALVARLHGSLGFGARLAYRGSDAELFDLMRFDRELARAVDDDLARLMAEAVALVETHRATVVRVADALVVRRVLDRAALRDLMRHERPNPRVH